MIQKANDRANLLYIDDEARDETPNKSAEEIGVKKN